MSEDWGPWIEHKGGPCPCVGQFVHEVYGDGAENELGGWEPGNGRAISNNEWIGIAEDNPSWRWDDEFYPIVRYRLKKPKGMQVLEGILKTSFASHGVPV